VFAAAPSLVFRSAASFQPGFPLNSASTTVSEPFSRVIPIPAFAPAFSGVYAPLWPSARPSAAASRTDPANMPMKTSDEFARGAIAAFINVLATFPVHKIMFRQQIGGVGFGAATKEILSEGFSTLWRGVIPPLLQRSSGVAVMFSTYKLYSTALSEVGSHPVLASALAGAASGLSESLLTPLERIQTILQHKDFNGKVRGTRHCASLLMEHGWKEFYRGFSAILFRCVGTSSLFFALRGPVKQQVLRVAEAMAMHDESPSARKVASSHTVPPNSRAYASPLHMHVEPIDDTEDDFEYMGYFWDQQYTPRAVAAPVAKLSRSIHIAADFTSGALLGGLIGAAFYPISVAKSFMQAKIGGRFLSTWEVIRDIRATRGNHGLLAGCGTNLVRGMLSWGLMNACYEIMSPGGLGYPSEWFYKASSVETNMVPPATYAAKDRTTPQAVSRQAVDEHAHTEVPIDETEWEAKITEHYQLKRRWKHAMRVAHSQFM
jgi:hypothetical protein